MEFNGVIQKVMPKRSGTSARTGNQWETQGFIFEYKENPTDRTSDSVPLETFSSDTIKSFEKWMEKDADGNPIVENGLINLTRPLYVHIGFGHRARTYTNEQTGKTSIFTDFNIYKFEWLKQPETPPTFDNAQKQPAAAQAEQSADGEQTDDLPF